MQSEIRRIVAVAVHRGRVGRCPVRVHSLGTGETFEIRPAEDGFTDVSSGLTVKIEDGQILLPQISRSVDLALIGDVAFEGFDHDSHERFTGRAGGGASVTLYDQAGTDYFQYAVACAGDAI